MMRTRYVVTNENNRPALWRVTTEPNDPTSISYQTLGIHELSQWDEIAPNQPKTLIECYRIANQYRALDAIHDARGVA